MKYIHMIPLMVTVFFCGCKLQSPAQRTIKMVHSYPSSQPGSKKMITASVIIDTVQKKTDEGIKFSIVLKNDSDKNIVLNNILDRLGFEIRHQHGRLMLLPQPALAYSHPRRFEEVKWLTFDNVKIIDHQLI